MADHKRRTPRRPALVLTWLLVAALCSACGASAVKSRAAPKLPSAAAIAAIQPSPTNLRMLPGTPPHLSSLHFVNAQDGWAGGQGVILATTDGGASWQTQYSGLGTVTALSFVSPTVGFAASSDGLLRMTSGGSWSRVSARVLQGVQFLTVQEGYGITLTGNPAKGTLLGTTDGGKSWHPLHIGPVQKACFVSPQVGIAADATPYGGTMQVERTTDGGAAWSTVLSVSRGFRAQLQCSPDGGAWLVASGFAGMSQQSYAVYHSADGGLHWTPVLAVSTAGAGPAPGNTKGVRSGPGASPGPISAVNGTTAVMTGICEACGAGSASFAATTDGGGQWQMTKRPVAIAFGAVLDMLTAKTGWLLSNARPFGSLSQIEQTTDGGTTWHTVNVLGAPAPLAAVTFVNPREAFGVGSVQIPQAVEASQDGGKTWHQVGSLPTSAMTYGFGQLAAAGPRTLYYLLSGQVQVSLDGGQTWAPLQTAGQAGLSPSVNSMVFSTPSKGCAAAGPTPQLDYVTKDGGRHWSQVTARGVPAAVCAMSLTDPTLANRAKQLIAKLSPVTVNGLPPYRVSTNAVGGGSLWIAFTSNDSKESRLYVLSPGHPVQEHIWPDYQININELSPLSWTTAYLTTTDGRLLLTKDSGAHWTQIP